MVNGNGYFSKLMKQSKQMFLKVNKSPEIQCLPLIEEEGDQ